MTVKSYLWLPDALVYFASYLNLDWTEKKTLNKNTMKYSCLGDICIAWIGEILLKTKLWENAKRVRYHHQHVSTTRIKDRLGYSNMNKD